MFGKTTLTCTTSVRTGRLDIKITPLQTRKVHDERKKKKKKKTDENCNVLFHNGLKDMTNKPKVEKLRNEVTELKKVAI